MLPWGKNSGLLLNAVRLPNMPISPRKAEGSIIWATTKVKTLLDAFRAGKVDQQARSRLPIPVLFMLDGGPTVDFILGRIFESAMQDTSRQLIEASNNKETRKIIAGQNFSKRNCALL